METEWVLAQIDLYRLMREHAEWSIAHLAETLGYSASWVKKWRRRFRAAERVTLASFQSQPRAPHPTGIQLNFDLPMSGHDVSAPFPGSLSLPSTG